MSLSRQMSRRQFALLSLSLASLSSPSLAQSQSIEDVLDDLAFGSPDAFTAALAFIKERGKPDMVAPLITAMRFGRAPDVFYEDVMRDLTGEVEISSWFEWMLWQESHPEVVPHPAYVGFKRELLLQIDPNFDVFLKPEHLARDRMKIRLEEITWGGVRKDGIPSLDNPELVSAADAGYLRGSDLVFGVSINGDVRAYPLRIMGWHEMFNEVIGGVPVALAYCTLCGSGILFETQLEGRAEPLVFGSSGFLYRSNKLMFDRETHSLWNQFTGKPVSGDLVDSGIELAQRPVVITSWDEWKDANPDTKVLSLNTGHRRDYGPGVVYNDYFSSPKLMFPALVDEKAHAQKDYVFGIRRYGGAKAWPLKAFEGGKMVNDGIGDVPLVLVGDEGTRTVRAYERGDLEFSPVAGGNLASPDGVVWELKEEQMEASDGRTLPRVAGHIAYWFAWNGYLGAESELYGG